MITKLLTILLEWLYSFGEGIMNLANKLLLALSQSGGGGADPEAAYVEIVNGFSPSVYWKLDEASGTGVTQYGSISGATGTHSASDIAGAAIGPFGAAAPLYVPGDSNLTATYTAALSAAYTQQDVSWSVWFKFGGTWSDSSNAYIWRFYSDANNRAFLAKVGVNTLRSVIRGGGVAKTLEVNVNTLGIDDTNWHHVLMVANQTGNTYTMFIDGVSRDTDTAATWGGTGLNSDATALGSSSVSTPANLLTGSIAHFAWIESVLDGDDAVALYNGGPV